MPENKVISFGVNEYPQISGLKTGEKVKFSGEASLTINEDGSGSMTFESFEVEAENSADRTLKEMTSQDSNKSQETSSDGDDF